MTTGYQSKILDHLGLVAGMYDELGIGDVIDRAIKQDHSQRHVSIGQAVKAMVLNGLGFVNQRLYLVPSFFQSKPTDRLIGEGVHAEHLNDDTLGRALDSLFEHDVTTLYSMVSHEAVHRLGLDKTRFGHVDITSFHLDGKYNSEQSPEEGIVHITQGYSRDHRPDLNQVGLELIVEHKANLPILMKPLGGNASDKSEFNHLINAHVDQMQKIDYLVADSALYTEKNLQDLGNNKWITRVPEVLKEAKNVIQDASPEAMIVHDENYHYQNFCSVYGGVQQRWILIESELARKRSLKTVNRRTAKGSEQERKAFASLCRQSFACIPDARQALVDFKKQLEFTMIEQVEIISVPRYMKTGRPKKEQQPDHWEYQITGAPATSIEKRNVILTSKSRFILATNELDESLLPSITVLEVYKGQNSTVERGFRFLKDPLFLASSLFLKSPQRIMALLMVMTICLLVYAALEHRIRQALTEKNQTVPDQKGNPIQNPTGRWIFQLFVGIHLLIINEVQKIVLNVENQHRTVLTVLGKPYEAFYY